MAHSSPLQKFKDKRPSLRDFVIAATVSKYLTEELMPKRRRKVDVLNLSLIVRARDIS